jgi:hypothetical protein
MFQQLVVFSQLLNGDVDRDVDLTLYTGYKSRKHVLKEVGNLRFCEVLA